MYDILLKNGLIVDGTGEKAYQADLAVENGKIAAISPAIDPGLAKETVDVSGLVVAPGFIDMHSHSDLSFLRDDRGEAKLYQGVTSELVGQCGYSPYPCPPGKEPSVPSCPPGRKPFVPPMPPCLPPMPESKETPLLFWSVSSAT